MHAAQRLAANEALQAFDPQRELPLRQRALARNIALAQAVNVLRYAL